MNDKLCSYGSQIAPLDKEEKDLIDSYITVARDHRKSWDFITAELNSFGFMTSRTVLLKHLRQTCRCSS